MMWESEVPGTFVPDKYSLFLHLRDGLAVGFCMLIHLGDDVSHSLSLLLCMLVLACSEQRRVGTA